MDDVSKKIKEDLIGTGIFLERDVYEIFNGWTDQRYFTVERESPYSYGTHPIITNGTVDVLAETSIDNGSRIIILAIECKKADPNLKNWVFETNTQNLQQKMPSFMSYSTGEVSFTQQYNFTNLGYNRHQDYENCINGFEFSAEKGNISRSAERSQRAFFAIKQVNESIRGVIEKIGSVSRDPGALNIILPVVVTTANLFVAEYNAKDIKRSSGDIDPEKLNLKPKDWLIYSYPLEFHEGISGKDAEATGLTTRPNKRPTFIVNVSALPDFIHKLIADIEYFG